MSSTGDLSMNSIHTTDLTSPCRLYTTHLAIDTILNKMKATRSNRTMPWSSGTSHIDWVYPVAVERSIDGLGLSRTAFMLKLYIQIQNFPFFSIPLKIFPTTGGTPVYDLFTFRRDVWVFSNVYSLSNK